MINLSIYCKMSKNSFIFKEMTQNIKDLLKFVFEILKTVGIALLIVVPIRYFLFQPFSVDGVSMYPNYNHGDYLIVDEISYRLRDPKRGEVIIFKSPLDESQRYIKRIIGLPGETVNIADGSITIINSEGSFLLNESEYFFEPVYTDLDTNITLGDGQYFVLGDNRSMSYDSRRWGTVPEENIIGKAWLRIFPLSNMLKFVNPQYIN